LARIAAAVFLPVHPPIGHPPPSSAVVSANPDSEMTLWALDQDPQHVGKGMLQWQLAHGRSPAEVLEWKTERRERMLKSGMPTAEVERFWGDDAR